MKVNDAVESVVIEYIAADYPIGKLTEDGYQIVEFMPTRILTTVIVGVICMTTMN